MPRDHSRIHLDIWGDDDWLDVSPAAQHLYFVLYTWPPTLCGAGDWQPRKIAARSRGWTVPTILDAAEELVNGGFVLIDLDTEEYLIRSWVKHDGLYRVQNMAISVANARANLASRQLRGVVVHEVAKLRKAEPGLDSWNKDPVKKMLDQKAVDPSDTDWPSPWDSPSASSWARGKDRPDTTGEPSPSASTSPTPCPTPTPNSQSQKPEARGSRLPAGWEPPADVVAQMRSEHPGIDLRAEHAKFTDYWIGKAGKDARKADWTATWRNWIRRAAENPRNGNNHGPKVPASDAAVAAVEALMNSTDFRLELE